MGRLVPVLQEPWACVTLRSRWWVIVKVVYLPVLRALFYPVLAKIRAYNKWKIEGSICLSVCSSPCCISEHATRMSAMFSTADVEVVPPNVYGVLGWPFVLTCGETKTAWSKCLVPPYFFLGLECSSSYRTV